MALHPAFPRSPYAPLDPAHRWFPADEASRGTAYEQLLPPLVARIRVQVAAWRSGGYPGASPTSAGLLRWWFGRDHTTARADGSTEPFRWYFAQQEAVETVIWLYDVARARDKHDLMRFDASGSVSHGMFAEDWPRYVLKMATGAGKTKVLSLLIAWSYFHRLYESGSTLARNILLVAPNIIVLDRLRSDFDGLRIFFRDPVLPDNGHSGRAWRDDFQLDVHLQDEVRLVRATGNLFLTNVHRIHLNAVPEPSLDDDDLADYFLQPFGARPSGKAAGSGADLGELIRGIDELAVFNDEAHHIHDERMAWFGSIRDIHHRMRQRDAALALQLDVTATPRHDNGAIFVQTVADYPLVEAIHQGVVKHPVLPDPASLARLTEHPSAIFHERYADYLALGVEEWRKSAAEHARVGKKAVLFVMVDDTRNCDEVGAFLERICPELQNAVLTIHTKRNGDIAEAPTGKDRDELDRLRRQAHDIDRPDSPHKAIVSVLMLKEGWDVRNVTVIVGLRAYTAKSAILPEQTLGRGLRRMYFGSDEAESVSVMGTPAFIEFIEGIKREGVELDRVPMGGGTRRADSLVIEVDRENPAKDLAALDIALPRLARRFHRRWGGLAALDARSLAPARLARKAYPLAETRKITFRTLLDGQTHHIAVLGDDGPADGRSVVAFFARQLLRELHLVGGYDVVYRELKAYVRERLFSGAPLDLDDRQALRNLAEPAAAKAVFDTFKAALNALTLDDAGSDLAVDGFLRLSDTRPFRTEPRDWLAPKRSIFNRVVGQPHAGGFELRFARFLDDAPGVAAFAKNDFAVGFRLDYVKTDGDLSTYTPDFIVKLDNGDVTIVETKGREELDLPRKMARLAQWCADATAASAADAGPVYRFVYVDESGFDRHPPTSFDAVATMFRAYQPAPPSHTEPTTDQPIANTEATRRDADA